MGRKCEQQQYTSTALQSGTHAHTTIKQNKRIRKPQQDISRAHELPRSADYAGEKASSSTAADAANTHCMDPKPTKNEYACLIHLHAQIAVQHHPRRADLGSPLLVEPGKAIGLRVSAADTGTYYSTNNSIHAHVNKTIHNFPPKARTRCRHTCTHKKLLYNVPAPGFCR